MWGIKPELHHAPISGRVSADVPLWDECRPRTQLFEQDYIFVKFLVIGKGLMYTGIGSKFFS